MALVKLLRLLTYQRFIERYSSFQAFLALTVIGVIYYGSFYNYGFSWGDEGSVALIAEKMFNGEKPYIDVEIGYGIFWYLPIVFLFKVFGVKFYLVRIFFLGIGLASALFAHALMMRLTANRLLAFLSALPVLMFPGCIYQTYIPFLVISGLYVLLLYDAGTLKPRINPWLALIFNGAYLGVAYLIRSDVPAVYTFIFLLYQGLLALQALMRGEPILETLQVLFARIAGVAFVAAIVALPFAIEAKTQGYWEEFLHQYTMFAEQLVGKIQQRFFLETSDGVSVAGSLLPRPSLLSFFHVGWVNKGLIFLTYAPIVMLLVVVIFMVADFFARQSKNRVRDFISERIYLLMILLGAISSFPQFFVWRPDIWHLAGFLPGFLVLIAYFLFILSRNTSQNKNIEVIRHWSSLFLAAFYSTYIMVFFIYNPDGPKLFQQDIVQLKMDKGVDLYLPRQHFQLVEHLTSMVKEESKPGEFVLCFPYCPGFNFLADRPTFQKYLYVDDSFLILRPEWMDDMGGKIVSMKPKIIIIDDWDINQTEISRFRNWAKPLYDQITKSYERKANFEGYEVFVLK